MTKRELVEALSRVPDDEVVYIKDYEFGRFLSVHAIRSETAWKAADGRLHDWKGQEPITRTEKTIWVVL